MKKILADMVRKLLDGRVLRVLSGPLRGLKLRVTPLIKINNFVLPYEPDKQMAFDLLLKKDAVFFDVGANIGLHSYFTALKFPEASIYAFEPMPDNAVYISEVIRLNNLDNIKVIQAAISNESGKAFFDFSDNNSKGRISEEHTDVSVETYSLDDFVKENAISPDVVKVDVEGAEGKVLEGAVELMKNRPPIFIIELHTPEQDRQVARILIKHGYSIKRLNPSATGLNNDLLLEIKNTSATWPDPDGVWGSIVAIH
ncbi:MAG TPA: FkbM family methyltransferase [Cyclobacteriaceae bacterium]|nr:FkbM family methyltransferase [Cyclobacteriaceae bacterium]